MSVQKEIKWILFDLGGVLIDYQPARRKKAFLSAGVKHYDLLVDKLASMLPAWGRGELSAAAVYTKLSQDAELNISFETFSELFCHELCGVNHDMIALMQALKPNYHLACLTDTIDLHWDYLVKSFDFITSFETVFASHILGRRKIDPDLFEDLAKQLGVSATNLLLIDDREENIEAAQQQGCQIIHFTAAAQCREELKRLGVHF